MIQSLSVVKSHREVLSKNQKKFNRLLSKVDTLKTEISDTTARLSQLMTDYNTHVVPLQKGVADLHGAIALTLNSYRSTKKLTRSQRETLADIVADQIDMRCSILQESPTGELQTIYEEINGCSVDEIEQEAFEDMLHEMIDSADFIDPKSRAEMLKIKNIEELQEYIAKKIAAEDATTAAGEGETFDEHFASSRPSRGKKGRPKSKATLAKEERAKKAQEFRQKSIASIYRKLARELHPDLEPDAVRRQEKEELLKTLSTAYENNDLLTLLQLELTYMQKTADSSDTANIADDQLAIFNDILGDQVKALEVELNELAHHPRFEPLRQFTMGPWEMYSLSLGSILRDYKKQTTELQKDLNSFASTCPNAIQNVKKLIRDYEEDLLDDDDWGLC